MYHIVADVSNNGTLAVLYISKVIIQLGATDHTRLIA